MTEIIMMLAILFAGLLLGIFFFGGLLWTVQRSLSAKHPSYWFFTSWLVRSAVILGAFYLISDGRWERLAICALGFFIARFILIRFARVSEKISHGRKEASNAT